MSIPVGKYMTAEPVGCEPHEVYTIEARDGSMIGHAEWYPRWRCYIFSPEFRAVFSHDCCVEMARFLESCDKATDCLDPQRDETTCSDVECYSVDAWQALPRVSEAAREIARELEADNE